MRQGVDLVVFPECMNAGYLIDSAAHGRELAEADYMHGLETEKFMDG